MICININFDVCSVECGFAVQSGEFITKLGGEFVVNSEQEVFGHLMSQSKLILYILKNIGAATVIW